MSNQAAVTNSNPTPNDIFKRMAADPALMDSAIRGYVERFQQQKREEAEFLASPTFKAIVEAIQGLSEPQWFDSEMAAYFPERMTQALDLPNLTKEDLAKFFHAMGDPQSPAVENGSRVVDAECDFPNCEYRLYGLSVSLLSGQGTIITVSNQ